MQGMGQGGLPSYFSDRCVFLGHLFLCVACSQVHEYNVSISYVLLCSSSQGYFLSKLVVRRLATNFPGAQSHPRVFKDLDWRERAGWNDIGKGAQPLCGASQLCTKLAVIASSFNQRISEDTVQTEDVGSTGTPRCWRQTRAKSSGHQQDLSLSYSQRGERTSG